MNYGEEGNDYDPEIIRAEIVEEGEMEPGAPWEWREVRPVPRQRRVRLPVLLFIATCLSTWVAGAISSSESGWLAALVDGLWYAVPVMTILLCHEMGHFIQAYRYGVYASLPYFIPMPFSPLGTFGAVIAMEPRMGHRKALFDIGISGPLAGLVPTFIFLIVGLHRSTFGNPAHGNWPFGSSLLFSFFTDWIVGQPPVHQTILYDQMAFAGWVGLLITSLNLIPIGQLDGGHVLYALLRRKANKVASFLLLLAVFLVALNFRELGSWIPMLLLVYFVVGTRHPPTADDDEPLGLFRIVLGWLMLAFIVVGFTPTPLRSIP